MALDTIFKAANAVRLERLSSIHVDHSAVKFLGLAAEAVLDRVIKDVREEFSIRGRPIRNSGALSEDQNISRFIRAIGITKALEIPSHKLSDDEEVQVRVFNTRSKRAAKKQRIDLETFQERTIDQFVQYLNNCLSDHNYQLTGKAKAELVGYIGEILDNVEEHSGSDDWTLVGYLDKPDDGPHKCDVVAFNFGKTIAESFQELPVDAFARKTISAYIDAHSRQGLFGPTWTEEDLIAVVALQGNISSKNESAADTRGHGTVELIEFFQNVCESFEEADVPPPEMAILSGRTHIRFDGRYRMARDESGRKVIAFNRNNDLGEPPDPTVVTRTQHLAFPGCAVSIRFSLPAGFVSS